MSLSLSIDHTPVDAPDSTQSLYELADTVDIHLPTSCRKQGKCRECLLEVTQGMELLSEPTPEEAHLKDNFRLSCRTRIVADSGHVECHSLKRGEIKVLDEAYNLPVSGRALELDTPYSRNGATILRNGQEVANIEGPIHGVAVDLGTTTVAMRLLNLETGHIVATQTFENPQRFGGSDVMARIQYDSDQKGRLLQRVLLGYMSHAIENFSVPADSILDVCIAGNATMRDLFFGLDVSSIGQRPYRSVTEQDMLDGKRDSTSITIEGRHSKLPIHPAAEVYGLPLIGCHVGADTAACLLAIDIANESDTVALMDIGTNTELILGNKDRLLAASCPAGPAFEGGELSSGMPGVSGAIERVAIDDNGTVTINVIGSTPAEGICGSGLIDLLSELVRTDRMNEMGRFTNSEDAFVLDAAQQVRLLENDISLLAQAKGANVAGLRIVFQEYGTTFDDLDTFYFAGGFARHIRVDAATRIGLIPDIPTDRIKQVGNASLEGATIALCSHSRRAELEALIPDITHVELETNPHFFDHFVFGCQYSPLTSDRPEAEG